MPKRSHGGLKSSTTIEESSPAASKRVKANENNAANSLAVLVENADELVECLRTLKQINSTRAKQLPLEPQHLEVGTRQLLSSLSRKLSPALSVLQGLAHRDEPTCSEASSTEGIAFNQIPKTPSPALFTKWTIADIPETLPTLPAILDPVLETAALTHSGMARGTTDMSYERLEWIGDSYLYVISCGFIFATFTALPPGKCSHIREMLVRNSTLAGYTQQYGLDKRANFPAEFGLGGRPGGTKATEKERTKVLGDIFEAYVGAIVLSDPDQGFIRASSWLKSLWATTIQKEIRGSATEKSSDLPPKVVLANLIQAKGVKLRYEDAPSKKTMKDRHTGNPLYTINLFLDGWGETNKLIGWGTAISKSEAGHKAAQVAIDNKKLMGVYSKRKEEFMAAIEAQKRED